MNSSLDDVLRLARRLDGFPGSWWVAGGWAIDVWLGRATRAHADLEIGVFRNDQGALRHHFAGWRVERVAGDGAEASWVPFGPTEELVAQEFQLRLRLPDEDSEFEVFLNDTDGGEWVSRRHPTVRVPLHALVCQSPLAVPMLAPEIQLLYKAKYHRPKDEHDFEHALPTLTTRQRTRLRGWLEEYHPEDEWLRAL